MALKNKYQRQKQQYSDDGGSTWYDVSPANYRRGNLIEAGSEDCNTVEWREVTGAWFCVDAEPITRWITVSGEFLCDTGNKYAKEKEQSSSDGGVTWMDTGRTRQGELIEESAEDCTWGEKYLTFVLLEDSKFRLTTNESYGSAVYYSLDNGTNWNRLTLNTETPTISSGSKVLWKGELPGTNNGIGQFKSTGRFDVKGNIMSLQYGDNFIGQTDLTDKVDNDYVFYRLFAGTDVVNANKLILPATTLESSCYSQMFMNCTSLETPPELPATTLKVRCYANMFYGCTSLVNAPELPATTMVQECYTGMFRSCTSLVNAPALPATTLALGCYDIMFQYCSSIVTAPVLPASRLVKKCYNMMFHMCTSLNYIKMLATEGFTADDCLNNWVASVSSTGTFVKSADATWDRRGNSGIPYDWTVITE